MARVAVMSLIIFELSALLGGPSPSGAQVLEHWTVNGQPELVVGRADGAEPYLLTGVMAATVLSDGVVVVVSFHRGFFEVRYFDPQGIHIGSVGRWGEGPFEFTSAPGVVTRLAGDSLYVASWDFRFAVFGPRGEQGRSGRLTPIPGARPIGLRSNGHLVLLASRNATGSGRRGETTEYEYLLLTVGPTAASVDTVGVMASARTIVAEDGAYLHSPFQPVPVWAVGPNTVWYTGSASRTVQGRKVDGRQLTAGVRTEPHTVTPDDRRMWQRFDLRGVSDALAARYRRHHHTLEYPDSMPWVGHLFVDRGDRLWACLYEPPYSTEPFRFEVFNPEGFPLAEVTVPFALLGPGARRDGLYLPRILEIGDNYLLVIGEDELGVQRLMRYRLSK